MFAPSGTGGFEDLERAAVPYVLGTVRVRLAALPDIIRSKTAAGRPKDLRALAELHALAAGGSSQVATGTAADIGASSHPTPQGTVSAQAAAQARMDATRAAAQRGRGGQGSTGQGSTGQGSTGQDGDERGGRR